MRQGTCCFNSVWFVEASQLYWTWGFLDLKLRAGESLMAVVTFDTKRNTVIHF